MVGSAFFVTFISSIWFNLFHDEFHWVSGMAKNNATGMAVRSTWAKCADGKLVGLGLGLDHHATYRFGKYHDKICAGSVFTAL